MAKKDVLNIHLTENDIIICSKTAMIMTACSCFDPIRSGSSLSALSERCTIWIVICDLEKTWIEWVFPLDFCIVQYCLPFGSRDYNIGNWWGERGWDERRDERERERAREERRKKERKKRQERKKRKERKDKDKKEKKRKRKKKEDKKRKKEEKERTAWNS